MNVRIRKAALEDVPVLNALIEASVRKLQAEDYTTAQMEGALKTVFGVDSQLISDGTYLVAEVKPNEAESAGIAKGKEGWVIAGCGGWSKRKTLFGGDAWTAREDSLLHPLRDAAKIRAFFIHPDWARRGIGSMILQACENAAKAEGFTCFEMGATLTGAKLFGAQGYVAVENIEVPLKNGESLPVIHMRKKA